MKSLHKYFIKQTANFWRDLSLRLRIEILILIFIYFAFIASRLADLFGDSLQKSEFTAAGLSSFLLHVFILLLSVSIPFIHLYLLPKQKSLATFRILPLNQKNSFLLLLLLHLKYQLIGFILILPVITALLFSVPIYYALYFLPGIIFYLILFILFMTLLSLKIKQPAKIIFYYFMVVLVYNALFTFLYTLTDFYVLFDIFTVSLCSFFLSEWWKKNWMDWDLALHALPDLKSRQKPAVAKINYFSLGRFVPKSIHPIFAKEFLNFNRNRRYLRLKILSFFLFIFALGFLGVHSSADFAFYTTILTCLVIWAHFSLQFNEKYVKADSCFFMKTLPFHFYQIWVAKFLNEYMYLLALQLVLIAALVYNGLSLTELAHLILFINVFSIIILIMIVNFKILFYDQPRFAGYAYHFFVIFTTVMSMNYRLVGPMITLTLIIYFSISSYREFAR